MLTVTPSVGSMKSAILMNQSAAPAIDEASGQAALLLMATVLAALAVHLLGTAFRPYREVLKLAAAAFVGILLVSIVLIMLIAAVAMSAR